MANFIPPPNGASQDRNSKKTKWFFFLNMHQCFRFFTCKPSLSMSLPPSLLLFWVGGVWLYSIILVLCSIMLRLTLVQNVRAQGAKALQMDYHDLSTKLYSPYILDMCMICLPGQPNVVRIPCMQTRGTPTCLNG